MRGEFQYWIQEQAPDGGWVDRVGYDKASEPKMDKVREDVKGWRKAWPGQKFRAVIKFVIPLPEGK